jgi:uncharacterized repeat protein (TIGR01451 family)
MGENMKRTLLLCAGALAFAGFAGAQTTSTPTPTRSPTPTPTSNRTADLSITKVASPDPARVGQDLTYTLTVRSKGPSNAIDVSVDDSLSADVQFVSVSLPDSFSPNASCSHGSRGVTCFLGVFGAGGTQRVILVVKPTSAGVLTNEATVRSSATDPNSSDNRASLTTEVLDPAFPLYLRGNANPVVLSLESAAPTAVTPKFRDSATLRAGLQNPWVEIGVWPAQPSAVSGVLSGLEELHAWLGLKNSDDQGTQFDLRAEAWKNGVELVGAGETACVNGVTRDPARAREATVPFDVFAPVTFDGTTDVLSLKVLTRIGTRCSGPNHAGAAGLRLYFDAVGRPARFSLVPAGP